jgi:hypothetical protein
MIKSATIEKTKDGRDYKVVFVKVLSSRNDAVIEDGPQEGIVPAVVINDYGDRKDPLMLEAEELVRYFHKVFHGVDSHAPQSKEMGQALSLISQHGLQAAKHVVDFAEATAAKTAYSIQHFGGVLSYASRALRESTRRAEPRSVDTRPSALAKPITAEQDRQVGTSRLAALSSDQYERRFEKTKAALFREQPFLAQAEKLGSSLIARNVRARIIRELDSQPMELSPFESDFLAKYPWLSASAQNLPL